MIVAMKPCTEKTYLDQALANGKGCTWLDDGRIPYKEGDAPSDNRWGGSKLMQYNSGNIFRPTQGEYGPNLPGRFAPNLLCSDDVLNTGKEHKSGGLGLSQERGAPFGGGKPGVSGNFYNDSGSYSRYFSLDAWADKHLPDSVNRTFPFMIVPKASKSEKNAGLDELEDRVVECLEGNKDGTLNKRSKGQPSRAKNYHPTVKPIKLMSYLIAIGSRSGDTVLDPYVGSGTAAISAAISDRRYIGIELDPEMCDIAERRIAWHVEQKAKAEQAQLTLDFAMTGGD